MQENNTQAPIPGRSKAIASLVLGIVGVALWFFGITSIASMILGIIGIILAIKAGKEGFVGGMRTAGLVLSIISVVGGAIAFVACVACVGAIGAAGSALSAAGGTDVIGGLLQQQ